MLSPSHKVTGLAESQGQPRLCLRQLILAHPNGLSGPASCLCSMAGQAAATRSFPIPACWVCQIGLCRFCVHVFPRRTKYKPLEDTKTHAVHKEGTFQLGVCSRGCRLGDLTERGCFGATSFSLISPNLPCPFLTPFVLSPPSQV